MPMIKGRSMWSPAKVTMRTVLPVTA
jgi:hypothetical protein